MSLNFSKKFLIGVLTLSSVPVVAPKVFAQDVKTYTLRANEDSFNLPWEVVDAQSLPKTFWKDHADRSWFDDSTPSEVTEYHIKTAAQLAGLALIVNNGDYNFKGKVIKIDNDIDLSQYLWWAIGFHYQKPFTGTIDGQNHIIRGLRYNQGNFLFETGNPDDQFSGFVGQCIGGTVKNLTFIGAKMITMTTSGVVAANLFDGGSLINCHVYNSAVQTLIKDANGKAIYRGTVAGVGYAGILVGGVNTGSNIIDCSVINSKFSGVDKCGAIAGGTWDGATIKNTFAQNVDITSFNGNGTAGYVGTIMPFRATKNTEITNGYVTGRVSCQNPQSEFVGGFVGRSGNLTVINNCYSAVKLAYRLPDLITSFPVSVGGFSGQILGGPADRVQNTFYDVTVSGQPYSMGVGRIPLAPFSIYGKKGENNRPIPYNSSVINDSDVELEIPFPEQNIYNYKVYYKLLPFDEFWTWTNDKKESFYPNAENGVEYHKGDKILVSAEGKKNYILFSHAEVKGFPENNQWTVIRFNNTKLPIDQDPEEHKANKNEFNTSLSLRAGGQVFPLPNPEHGKLIGFSTDECKSAEAVKMLNNGQSEVVWKTEAGVNNGYPFYRNEKIQSTKMIAPIVQQVECIINNGIVKVISNDIQSIKIYNMEGCLVQSKNGLGGINEYTFVENIQPGIYILNVNSSLGQSVVKIQISK